MLSNKFMNFFCNFFDFLIFIMIYIIRLLKWKPEFLKLILELSNLALFVRVIRDLIFCLDKIYSRQYL